MDKRGGLSLQNSMNNVACENFYDWFYQPGIVVVIKVYIFFSNCKL